jgi:hypothetical protein
MLLYTTASSVLAWMKFQRLRLNQSVLVVAICRPTAENYTIVATMKSIGNGRCELSCLAHLYVAIRAIVCLISLENARSSVRNHAISADGCRPISVYSCSSATIVIGDSPDDHLRIRTSLEFLLLSGSSRTAKEAPHGLRMQAHV